MIREAPETFLPGRARRGPRGTGRRHSDRSAGASARCSGRSSAGRRTPRVRDDRLHAAEELAKHIPTPTSRGDARRRRVRSEDEGPPVLRSAAATCRGCDSTARRPRPSSEGAAEPRAVFVGEAQGDSGRLQGRPSWAWGEVLRPRLVAAGLPRGRYVTNAVKHFKVIRTPKRRIHKTPGSVEIAACRLGSRPSLAIIRRDGRCSAEPPRSVLAGISGS